MAEIKISDLTTSTLDGTGVFDELMRAVKAHLAAEYDKGRIKGTEYATVYLGALQATMDRALQFVLAQEKTYLENEVLKAQKCKLDAEFDLIQQQTLKAAAETALLNQKNTTEKAQTMNIGDPDSVIGRQKTLYKAQADGFQRDAEQKAAKLMVDSWNVRRTTDEGTSANSTNQLDDAAVGRAVSKLLSGVGA